MGLSLETLKQLLSFNKSYLNQDGTINTTKLYKLAQECNHELVDMLASHDDTRNKFFLKRGSYHVFTRDLFIDYISHKDFLANSYTKYKNKIGLHNGKEFIKKTNDVVLSFPFKDCILEGGQCKDEEKRREVYFNEVLASEEIDRLKEKKVLTQGRRYDGTGRHTLEHFTRNENNTITDNLIIKGNNLLALHSIKHEFRGKIKLIYIDPPYNTGNDSFHYNDNFNHSTWLVFMKNRLEIALELLRDDGVIFVQCDDNEQAYLKVLMDEVFGRENFRNLITSKVGTKNVQNQFDTWDKLSNACDLILFYSKNSDYRFPKSEKKIDIKSGFWNNHWRGTNRPTMRYELFGIAPEAGQWRWSKENSLKAIKNYEAMIKDFGKEEEKITQEEIDLWYLEQRDSSLNLLRLSKNNKPEHYTPPTDTQSLNSVWMDLSSNGNSEIKKIFTEKVFATPKPEALLQRILEISTQPGDIVLDYHLGSGTTAAVAHKMGRQYIGIEQMDYIEDIAVERLKKVIDGEQGGISKSVAWNGGGAFLYFELKKYNQAFLETIMQAKTTEELMQLRDKILSYACIDYRLDTQSIQQHDAAFTALKLHEQQKILCDFLDLNQLYVNYTEREDAHFACTDHEKHISTTFYASNK